MDNPSLSPEELKTQETYRKIVSFWANKFSDSTFWSQEFEKFRELLPSGSVIDLGCGTGRYATPFTQAGYRYIGIDISEALLSEARKLVQYADFRLMSLYTLEFPSQCFDGFWAAASLLHIPKRNLPQVLANIKDIVKPNGVGFVSVKEGEGEGLQRGAHPEDERFFAYYKEQELREILAKAGFTTLETIKRESRTPEKATTVWLAYLVRIK